MGILIFNKLSHKDAPYEQWVEDLDEELYLLTSESWSKDLNGYQHIYSFSNYDFNNNIEWTAIELYEGNPYHTIIATAERDILRVARLRQHLGLEGQSLESAYAFCHKGKMKTILQKAGVRVPIFQILHSTYDLYEFIQQHGYPVVIKPVDGMGSRDTTVINHRHDLRSYLKEGLSSNLEVEEYIEGEIYHVDGVIIDGKLIHLWPSKYLNDCLLFHEEKYLGSYLLEPANPLTRRLQSYISYILDILPTPLHTSFHAEVFHTPQDELILCEIACCTGGSRIAEEFRQAFHLDLTKCSVQAQCGLSVKIPIGVKERSGPTSQYGFLGIPAREGTFISGPDTDQFPDWVTEYILIAKPGAYYTHAYTSVDYVCTILVKGDSEKQVLQRLYEAAKQFEQQAVWK
ncbi:ATP-grasp domain-containing protein [Hazenella coriacea]|uniref:ATP-grasp domain-containing protein n=1 Tax=Hazenella coriacea TaxID=1179467 RepID=A0A4R3L9L3_9BACL|nr:ATP-grasp domain-containing protein [Hazenella coriacea]TCS95810.1 ATP-grasp domain-containing protein [Hazenella coriacea]